MNGEMTQRLVAWWHEGLILGMPPSRVAVAAAAALLAWLAMTIGLRFARKRLAKLATHTRTHIDDALVEMLGSTQRWLIALAALLIGVGLLELPAGWTQRVGQLWFLALAVQLALWLNRLVGIVVRRHWTQTAATGTPMLSAAGTLMSWGLRTVLWAIVLLAILSNLGVNITAFVASLGVGGIAVALAVQNILGDLFASMSIAIDKPFEVGDFIVLGSVAGTVENVGLKTTRIRSLGGEQIVMSNTELLKQTVSNYKRLLQRRIVFSFGVTYDTTPDELEAIGGIVKSVVQESDRVRFDRAHFKAFGDSSLDFEVVYIVLDPDYNVYMEQQQRINLGLMRALQSRGIDFAFPTRTLHIVGNGVEPARGGEGGEKTDYRRGAEGAEERGGLEGAS